MSPLQEISYTPRSDVSNVRADSHNRGKLHRFWYTAAAAMTAAQSGMALLTILLLKNDQLIKLMHVSGSHYRFSGRFQKPNAKPVSEQYTVGIKLEDLVSQSFCAACVWTWVLCPAFIILSFLINYYKGVTSLWGQLCVSLWSKSSIVWPFVALCLFSRFRFSV